MDTESDNDAERRRRLEPITLTTLGLVAAGTSAVTIIGTLWWQSSEQPDFQPRAGFQVSIDASRFPTRWGGLYNRFSREQIQRLIEAAARVVRLTQRESDGALLYGQEEVAISLEYNKQTDGFNIVIRQLVGNQGDEQGLQGSVIEVATGSFDDQGNPVVSALPLDSSFSLIPEKFVAKVTGGIQLYDASQGRSIQRTVAAVGEAAQRTTDAVVRAVDTVFSPATIALLASGAFVATYFALQF